MKRSPFLICSRRTKKAKEPKSKTGPESVSVDLDEDEWEFQYDLKRPDEIVIVDDTNAYQFFGDSVFSAPQEDLLESMCAELLSSSSCLNRLFCRPLHKFRITPPYFSGPRRV